MKRYLAVSLSFVFSTLLAGSVFADTGDRCETASDCDNGESCISNVCGVTGAVSITLTWTGATDLDLHVRTPSGKEISPDITDSTQADGGRIILDECHSGSCENDPRPASDPHAEHVVWDRNTAVRPGRYRVWAENFDGAAATNYEIIFKHPDGKTEAVQGTVSGSRGARSTQHTFNVKKLDCDEDTDGDGLCDAWEIQGMDVNNDGVIDLDLPAMGADPHYKDIFLEIDWIIGDPVVPMGELVRIFKKAPVDNPNGRTGIAVHIELSDEITSIGGRAIQPKQPINFGIVNRVKYNRGVCRGGAWFGSAQQRASSNCEAIMEARKLVFHYLLNADSNDKNGAAGQAERPGNDIIINTRRGERVRPRWEITATAHELGHNLGLGHGGQDSVNCKPNYLSMMNYAYLSVYLRTERPNFSMQKLPFLDENRLVESVGVQGPGSFSPVRHGIGSGEHSCEDGKAANRPQDWNRDGTISSTPVAFDVTLAKSCSDRGLDVLHSFEDWSNLQFNFRDSIGYRRDGIEDPNEEEDSEVYEEEVDVDILIEDINGDDPDGDGIGTFDDICPDHADPNQEDRDGDAVGDACDACPDENAFGSFDGCPFEVDTIVDKSNEEPEDNNDNNDDNNDNNDNNDDGSGSNNGTGGENGQDGSGPDRPDRLDTQAGGCATTGTSNSLLFVLLGLFVAVRRRRMA